jgi:endoglucanase
VVGLALVLLVVVAGGAWWALGGGDSEEEASSDQRDDPAGPLVDADDPARGSVRFADSGAIVAGPEAVVEVEAPPGATEMQIGTDPTFTDVPWDPVADQVSLTIHDSGYQMLFARFRGADGEPSPVSVDGITIDPTYEAAVSSATGIQQASWVRPLSGSALMVRIEAGRLQRGAQEPYDFDNPPDGDEVGTDGNGNPIVTRGGEPYGSQVPGHTDLVRPYDVMVGEPLDGEALTTGTWTVTTGSGTALPVEAVERISRPAGDGVTVDGAWVVPVVHDMILTLGEEVPDLEPVTIQPPDGLVAPIEVAIDPDTTISPLVHVNQVGFAPDDSLKVAYVSGLIDGVGQLDQLDLEGRPFRVVSTEDGSVAHQGEATARPGGDEMGKGDLTGSAAYELDFSALDQPGRYRICVDGIGCSVGFSLDDGVWRRLAVTVARALYHQRSGVALGPPYTAIGRARPYHPDDGMAVTESSLSWAEVTFEPLENPFEALVEADTGEVAADAWGGHFDAGDWDRNINHLKVTRTLTQLVEADPELWAELDLNIPESGDAVPDLLDEGLWTLDLFRRLQNDDGSVPGGVEAAEHPANGSTSWTEDLAVFTFAPDQMGTFIYAGTAAEAAAVLAPYDAERAGDYLQSAEAAMAWAADQGPLELDGLDPDTGTFIDNQLVAARSVAALSLYKASGDQAWLDEFLDLTTLDDGVDRFLSCHEHGRCAAAWTYLSLDPELTDPELRSQIEESIVGTADEILAAADTTAYGFTVDNPYVPLVWGLGAGGTPRVTSLLQAYQVTGDEAYRRAALRSASYSLGANPLNASYVTGTGANPVVQPLIVDTFYGGLPVWAGTPVYGNHQVGGGDAWIDTYLLDPVGVSPLGADLPYLWQWFDISHAAMFNEYTVHQSHGPSLFAYAALASAAGAPGSD